MIRAGDSIYHKLTREIWLVALDEIDGRVYWCGYPFGGYGNSSDCTVEHPASDEERLGMLLKVAECNHASMAEKAKRQLAAMSTDGQDGREEQAR